MSHSPTEANTSTSAKQADSHFRQQLGRLDAILDHGGSFSGFERNCAFLNLGNATTLGPRFATISAVSGFDFDDDGRAVALTDWDDDGDLDVWVMNRTGPRVRFLQNEQENSNHFVQFDLQGTRSNRDAIGAAVEITASNRQGTVKLIKSLRAGEGFLAQSSKRIHFGLGKYDTIKQVRVTWPDGQSQDFGSAEVDSRYVLVEDAASAVKIADHRDSRSGLSPIPIAVPRASAKTRNFLSSRVPLPRMEFTHFGGNTGEVASFRGSPLLVNLWATWCKPCHVELQEFASGYERIQRSGLQVLALSVDGLASEQSATVLSLDDVKRYAARRQYPFHVAMASAELVRRLQFLDDHLYTQDRPIPIPSSFLVDSKGRLSVIYRGPVSLSTLRKDMETLSYDDRQLFEHAFPFRGRWYDGRRRFTPMAIPADLLANHFPLDAASFVLENQLELLPQNDFEELARILGDVLVNRGRMELAYSVYRLSLKKKPDNVRVLNNLAWYLAANNDTSHRDGAEAVRHAERAAALTNHAFAPVLDTLAAAYAEAGEFDKAVQTCQKALELASAKGDAVRVEKLRMAASRYRKRQRP